MNDIILDFDIGHDDAIALLVALANPEKINILGITTVAGNQTLENVTENALKTLDYFGYTIPVSVGCSAPLRYEAEPQPKYHGESGMDGPIVPASTSQVTGLHAVEYMRKTLLEHPGKVTIVAIGPLTNVGLLLYMYPEVKDKIDKVCIMGGSLHSGNTLPKAEFNIYHDPDAARKVFRSGVEIVMSGIEVCLSGAVKFTEYEPLQHGGKASRFVFDIMEFYSVYCREQGQDAAPVFDMTTVIQLLHPELFEGERYHVDVETEGSLCRGMTVADLRVPPASPRANTLILSRVVDREAFVKVMLDSLVKLDGQYSQ